MVNLHGSEKEASRRTLLQGRAIEMVVLIIGAEPCAHAVLSSFFSFARLRCLSKPIIDYIEQGTRCYCEWPIAREWCLGRPEIHQCNVGWLLFIGRSSGRSRAHRSSMHG